MDAEAEKDAGELDQPDKEEDDEETNELMKELKFDEYENEPTGQCLLPPISLSHTHFLIFLLPLLVDTPLFGGLKGLSFHADNSEDPYITMEEVLLVCCCGVCGSLLLFSLLVMAAT